MLTIDANTVFGFWPRRKVASTAEDLIARMDAGGVHRALTCSIKGWLYDFAEGNAETLQTCARYPDRLIPVATINPQRHFGVLDAVEQTADAGFRVVRFFPFEQEWSISQRHFTKLAEKLAQTDLIIMLPSTEGPTAIGRLAAAMPNPVVMESVRAYPALAEIIAVALDAPNLYIETHSIAGMDFVETLVAEVGEDRLVFGSGAPLRSVSASVLPIRNAAISEQAREMVLSGNILRLLEGVR